MPVRQEYVEGDSRFAGHYMGIRRHTIQMPPGIA